MKAIVLFFLCTLYIYANNGFIEQLHNQFNQQVKERYIYKKHFKHFLDKTCLVTDEICIDKTIQRLKSWESTQKNSFLKEDLKNLQEQTTISTEYFYKIKEKMNRIIVERDINQSQFFSFLDISRQLLSVLFYDHEENSIYYIGSDLTSSGNIEKEKNVLYGEDHYLQTPTGIFENIKGWRSKGEALDNNTVLPYGQKDRFVFYFGKQSSLRYNTFKPNKEKIKNKKEWKLITDYLEFAMHSHESSKELGIPNSHGCIRITHEMNLFLDEHLVLHKNNFQNNQWVNYNSKQPSNLENIQYAGKYLIIVNSI